ncbi:hypothetical protein JG687_00014227 [Phytophthora cactorum]|uniref:Uncharacterized protein n=1 Tax=Phytophthora cactorum TaxID=29920 RepID=A0A8T1TXG4_9STRA|nr:hypothetical protein JG687_00014227 [Phytophthora cactorum]
MTGFDLERWYNETWSARILNESEMVLETEFLAVWCFFFGFISTTSSLKELFRLVPRGSERRIVCTTNSAINPGMQSRLVVSLLFAGLGQNYCNVPFKYTRGWCQNLPVIWLFLTVIDWE